MRPRIIIVSELAKTTKAIHQQGTQAIEMAANARKLIINGISNGRTSGLILRGDKILQQALGNATAERASSRSKIKRYQEARSPAIGS